MLPCVRSFFLLRVGLIFSRESKKLAPDDMNILDNLLALNADQTGATETKGIENNNNNNNGSNNANATALNATTMGMGGNHHDDDNGSESRLRSSLKRSLNTPTIYYFRGGLDKLSFSTDGLYRIVSGKHFGSSDFSEMLAGILMSAVLGCKLSLVGIDKTLPRAMRSAGTMASGTPDLYMVQKAQGSSPKIIVSVKRFYVHDDRVDRVNLARHILGKACAGLDEYLKVIPLPGVPYIIVLTSSEGDAKYVHAVYESMQTHFTLFVIVIEDRGELGRMVFRYTQSDAEIIREMFAGKDNL